MANRPLSPHLSVYRFAYTMALSILHRITGMALTAGLLMLVLWFAALAGGEDRYAGFLRFAGSWPVKCMLAAGLIAFVYHFCNGVRHLCWDALIGIEKAQARRSAQLVVVVAIVVSLLLLLALFGKVAA